MKKRNLLPRKAAIIALVISFFLTIILGLLWYLQKSVILLDLFTILGVLFCVINCILALQPRILSPENSKDYKSGNDTVGITVHEWGQTNNTISDAKVTLGIAGRPHRSTQDDGRAVLEFNHQYSGKEVTITVNKNDYEDYNGKITLQAGEEFDIGLKKVLKKPDELISPPLMNLDCIYISDTKLHGRYEMLPAWQGKDIVPVKNRFQALNQAIDHLQKEDKIGNLTSGKPYISGEYVMKWGTITFGEGIAACFFFTTQTPVMLLMAGSIHHLVENRHKDVSLFSGYSSATYSNLPNIMSAIKFASEHNLLWTDGIGEHDYLSVLQFMQEESFHQTQTKRPSDAFPEQNLQFIARVLKTLPHPSEERVQKMSAEKRVNKHNKHAMRHTLLNSKDILICSPLYVALSDKQ